MLHPYYPKRYGYTTTLVLLSLMFSFFSACTSTDKSVLPELTKTASQYILMVDAGSTGSRLYVYKTDPAAARKNHIPAITLIDKLKVKPGLSEWASQPKEGAVKLNQLLDFAKKIVPADQQKQTPIYVMATAGMRLKSKAARDRTMRDVAHMIKADGSFDFKEAMVISGQYEGLYAWLALNFLTDRFAPNSDRNGLLEMGGASTQIAFDLSEKHKASKAHQLKRQIEKETYRLYARSYLYMGIDQTERLFGHPSCYPANFQMDNGQVGDGNCEQCINHLLEGFNSLCENLECREDGGPHCIFKEDAPPISSSQQFTAVSAYYYLFRTLGQKESIRLSALKNNAMMLCGTDYEILVEDYPKSKNYVHQYCLASSYYYTLFKKAFDFPIDQTNISIADEINGTDLNWTLGAVIDMLLGNVPEKYISDSEKK